MDLIDRIIIVALAILCVCLCTKLIAGIIFNEFYKSKRRFLINEYADILKLVLNSQDTDKDKEKEK